MRKSECYNDIVKPIDTALGGTGREFPATAWSVVLRAGDPAVPGYREALDRLCHDYWKPVHAYIRSAWGKTVEDAKDLTQAFFARFLENDSWSRLDPARGSFRGYVKRALHNFLVNAKEHDDARRTVLPGWSLDATPEEWRRLGAASPETPEEAFDREWFRALMDASIEELRREGKSRDFQVFAAYCLDSDTATYRDVATRLGLSESDVRNALSACRRSLRGIVSRRIGEYTSSAEEIEDEIRKAGAP